MDRPRLFGVLNLTVDSFSDGGRFLDPEKAVAHGLRLRSEGADVVDVGAAASHPAARAVTVAEELARLTPVVVALRAAGVTVSIDTNKPEVMRAMLACGVEWINDIDGFRDPQALDAVAATTAGLIVMHRRPFDAAACTPEALEREILSYFAERLAALDAAGVRRERLLLDPGLGLFLGAEPGLSVAVLRFLPRLRAAFDLPILVGPSRKSFIGALLTEGERPEGAARPERAAGRTGPRPPAERAAGSLAAELWAAIQGAAALRTHAPGPLADALRVWRALERGA